MYLTRPLDKVYGVFPSAASRALLLQLSLHHKGNRENGRQARERREELFPAEVMRRQGLGPQQQANLAWSLTVLESCDDDTVALLQNVFHAAESSSSDDGRCVMQLEHAHQLWQSYFLLRHDCPAAVQFVTPEFSRYLERKWNTEKSRRKQSSRSHRIISKTLNLMRVSHRNENEEDVDVAIALEEDSAWTHTAIMQGSSKSVNGRGCRKVAVEFDGPNHFTVLASTGKDLALMECGNVKMTPRVLGHTKLKYRYLKAKGWTVVRIPYYEFNKIPFWASMVSNHIACEKLVLCGALVSKNAFCLKVFFES